MPTRWKTVFSSTVGTSHAEDDLPCQDSIDVSLSDVEGRECLIACVADGAGSAKFSDVGSATACSNFLRLVHDDGFRIFDNGDDDLDSRFEGVAVTWCRQIRSAIAHEAEALNATVRQLACTFIGAIVFDDFALFVQIGDGAVVCRDSGTLSAVFWPQSGEYANTTNFITDEDFQSHLQSRVIAAQVNELAMFSDGLERLILKFADQTVHEPFLRPLFDRIREASAPEELSARLNEFLDSPRVNERTDDDKSLILAVRDVSDE